MFGRKSKSAGATPNKNQNGEPVKSPSGKSKKKDVSQQHGSATSSLPRNIFSFRRNRSRSSSGSVPSSSGPYSGGGQISQSTEIINQAVDPLTSSYTYGQGYPLEGFSSNSDQSPVKSKSPYQSPTHTLSGMQNVKGYIRDGSLDRSNHSRGFMMGEWGSLDRGSDRPHIGSARGETSNNTSQSLRERQAAYISKERAMERDYPPPYNNGQDRPMDGPTSYNNSKDRAIDREYPHMGARSLERDHYFHSRSRSMERPDYTTQLSQSQDLRSFRDSLILELQAQIAELNKECAKIQQEFDTCKDKLSSSMNSIKTFWSPELKKERALRKEETAKCNLLTEQMKVCQADSKKNSITVHGLESQLRSFEDAKASSQISYHEMEILKREKEKQAKELAILRKTIDEMELRIDTQKQTLNARDESIKKLLEMLQSKGLSVQPMEESRLEIEKLQTQKVEHDRRLKQLEKSLDQKETQLSVQRRAKFQQEPSSNHTLKAMLDAKESRIAAQEKDIQSLEEKLLWLREDGNLSDIDKADGSLKGSLPSRKQLMIEIENLKGQLSNKETEMLGLKLKAETYERQQTENLHYISVLKEQISAKEQHSGMLHVDMEDMRDRMKDKESTIDRKNRQSQNLQMEKRRLEAEVLELKDHVELKDRKISVLQRKIENLEDIDREKEDQIDQLKAKQTSYGSELSDSALSLASMEESLTEKERQIERLKEIKERTIAEHREECDIYIKSSQDLKSKIDSLQLELTEKQTEICEFRESIAELSAEKFQLESKVRQLEGELSEKSAEIDKLHTHLEELKNREIESKAEIPTTVVEEKHEVAAETEEEVSVKQEELSNARAEITRLLDILKESEEDKNEKEKQMKEQAEIIKEYKQKMGTLKRSQQTEKKKNAQLLEEARKREGDLSDDTSQLMTVMKQKDERIEELEEALRESVKITAEREMIMARQQEQLDETDDKIRDLTDEMEKSRASTDENSSMVASLKKQLDEREHKLKRLYSERHKHLEEVYEMKQEAIQAAISEKDANIALLEMTSTKKQKNMEEIDKLNREKEKLQQQLKELTQNRMRLLHKDEHHGESKGKSKKSAIQRMKGSTPEQVIRAIRKVEHSKKRLRTLIDQLLAVCLDTDPSLMEGLPRMQLTAAVKHGTLRALTFEQLLLELHQVDKECNSLQDYTNVLLQRIGSVFPDQLDTYITLLESSESDSCHSCQSN
ncbi:hypothetical protein ScPMuIL_007761 [Solemya velum]